MSENSMGMEPIPGIEEYLDKYVNEDPKKNIKEDEKEDITEVDAFEQDIADTHHIYRDYESEEWKDRILYQAIADMTKALNQLEDETVGWHDKRSALETFFKIDKLIHYNHKNYRLYSHEHPEFDREDFERRVSAIKNRPFGFL